MRAKISKFAGVLIAIAGFLLFVMLLNPSSMQSMQAFLQPSCSPNATEATHTTTQLQHNLEIEQLTVTPTCNNNSVAPGYSNKNEPEYAADHFLVVLDNAAEGNSCNQPVGNVVENLAAKNLNVIEAKTQPTQTCGSVLSVKVPDNANVYEAVEQAQATSGVRFAQPNYFYRQESAPTNERANFEQALNNFNGNNTFKHITNDPALARAVPGQANQYYLYGAVESLRAGHIVGANVVQAWDIARSNNAVTIAVLDSGANLNHEDLKANIDAKHAFDAYHNKKLEATNNFNGDYDGHGTHVCGIAGATANNSVGIAGASYNANILPIKIFDDVSSDSRASTVDMVLAYEYLFGLVDSGELNDLRVVNISCGHYGLKTYDGAVQSLITEAKTKNILTVCAGGNGIDDSPLTAAHYPSDYTDCLAVSALNPNGTNAVWSDFNKAKDISAPGVSIYSTYNEGRSSYKTMSGSSMASSLVSGIAALCFSANPNASPDDVKEAIKTTAEPIVDNADVFKRWPARTGSAGAINAASAVRKTKELKLQGKAIASLNDVSDEESSSASVSEMIDQNHAPKHSNASAQPAVPAITRRLAGNSAAQTSVAISQNAFDKANTVVLCRADDFKDAMSATGFAGALDAPILLTEQNSLTIETGVEILRLGAKTVLIIGGTGAVSAQVEADVSSIAGVEITSRVFGETAEDTSVECARRLAAQKAATHDAFDKAIVSMQDNFQDALSISSFAYKYHVPILLESSAPAAQDRRLPASAIDLLTQAGEFSAATVYIPGGEGAVSRASVEGALGQRTYIRLTEGNSGYDTSNYIADWMTTHGSSKENTYLQKNAAVVATGAMATKGVDALAGSALAGKLSCPILLVNDNAEYERVDTTTIDKFFANNVQTIKTAYMLGGTSVVSDALELRLKALMNG